MTDSPTIREVADALVAALRGAMKGALDEAAVVPSSAPALGPGWRIYATVAGRMRGELVAWIDVSGAETLAQRVRKLSAPPDQDVVIVVLADLLAAASTAMTQNDPFVGVTLTLGEVEPGEAEADAIVYELRAGDDTVWMAIGGRATAMAAESASRGSAASAASKLDVVLDIDLPLIVRFGRTRMTLRALSQVGPGSIIDMERSPDQPVQMLIGEQVIAHGEVVVVSGHYAVRVIDLVSAADRVRVLEG